MQRHRLPFRECGRSALWAASMEATVMIMPAAQNPHWNACASMNAFCTGCNVPSGLARPSMVVTFLPWARKAGIRHEWIGLPSIHTVQAPQSPASQPFLTPKKPRSRRYVRRHWPGAGSAETRLPLTVQFIAMLRLARVPGEPPRRNGRSNAVCMRPSHGHRRNTHHRRSAYRSHGATP